MFRLLFTLWFAVTALLGPGVCCCHLGFLARAEFPTETVPSKHQSSCCEEAPPAVPSCCSHGAKTPELAPAINNGEDLVVPAVPVKSPCPCQSTKHLKDAPGIQGNQANETLSSFGDQNAFGFAINAIESSWNAPKFCQPFFAFSINPPPLGGRDLLATYQILRC